MPLEIEYRYLLAAKPDLQNVKPLPITQGYLVATPDKTVRIRRIGDEGKLTVKGPKSGAANEEFEYDIPLDDALKMLEMCGMQNTLDKDRYEIPAGNGLTWEVDIFKGRHQGLMIAEIEVPNVDASFDKPEWLVGVDITEDKRFANAVLIGVLPHELSSNVRSVLALAGFDQPKFDM